MADRHHTGPRGDFLRRRICEEAARIMVEQQTRDFQRAKHKACERLGVAARAPLPSNVEIEVAAGERLQLFGGTRHSRLRRRRLAVALDVMAHLTAFSPRLTGADLTDTATRDTPIQLHLFAATVEQALGRLEAIGIPFELMEKRLRFRDGSTRRTPGCRFVVDDLRVENLIFPADRLWERPCSPIDGNPMARNSPRVVRALLAALD